MTTEQAQQTADLLNSRNRLTTRYTADTVMKASDEYIFESEGDTVVACVEVKRVQWYQREILHLSVRADRERRGWGTRMLAMAEQRARERGARIAQCTIRVGNVGSESAFRRAGFRETCRFENAASGNEVAVFQKAL